MFQLGVEGWECGDRGYACREVGVTGLDGRHLCRMVASRIRSCNTLWRTSPEPGDLSERSLRVRRQSAFPESKKIEN